MSYDVIRKKLTSGEVIILDGGTGTDIQRRGAPMSGDTWCADANLTHPHIVEEVHRDYIRAGADIITANSFATSPLLFSAIGRAADVPRIDAVAMDIARRAAHGTKVCVAGSMSTMRPMHKGSDRNNLAMEWPENEARALFEMKAQGLKAAGAECIFMELLRDTDYAVWASEAAIATGLPVWIGLSTERGTSGALQGWGRADCSFEAIAKALAALKPAVMTVMHTSPNDTGEALDILKRYWDGPIGTYPESGHFKAPDWVFGEVSPADLCSYSEQWRNQGATIFGGCCGIGPDHIAALTKGFR